MMNGVIPSPDRVQDYEIRVMEMPVERLMRESTIDFCVTCHEELVPLVVERGVKDLERSGRFEEAAQLYEELGMPDLAGEERMKARSSTSTTRHVMVDLNQLLEKLRVGGLALPYKCHSCGASINIDKDSRAEGLTYCSYCGTRQDTDALVALLKALLA